MSDESTNVQRSLGRIEGRLDSQDERHDRMERTLADQGDKMDKVLRYIERDRAKRGVWRSVGAGVAAVVSAAVSLGVTLWTSKHG